MKERLGGDVMIQKHSWEITDEFWEAAKPLIPPPERDSEKRTGGSPVEAAHLWISAKCWKVSST